MERPPARPGRRVFVGMLALTGVAAAMLSVFSQIMLPEQSDAMFDETGPFERASPWLWLGLAVLICLVFRRTTPGLVSGVVLSVACAAREWDLHQSLTDYSVLKFAFYGKEEFPLWQRALAGAAVLATATSTLLLLRVVWRQQPWRVSPMPVWAWALAFALFMLVFTKVLDRVPAIFRKDIGLDLPERALLLMSAWEEGLEMLLAVYFAGVALAFEALQRVSPYRLEAERASK